MTKAMPNSEAIGSKIDHFGDSAGIRFNKKKVRKISNMVAVRLPTQFPESSINALPGRKASEIVESKVFMRSNHAREAIIVEAAQQEVKGMNLLMLILDRNVCQPPFQKKCDRVVVIDPKIAEGARAEIDEADRVQQMKREHEACCHH